MSLQSVAHEGVVIALRDDYSDYMPHLAAGIDGLLRSAAQTRDSVAQLVDRLRRKHPDEYGHITEEAVRQRLVRLFSSGTEGVVVDGRGYVLGRRERGRRVLEVRRDDDAAGRRAEVVSALGARRPTGAQHPTYSDELRRYAAAQAEPRLFVGGGVTVSDPLAEIRALLVRPAAGGLPAYTVMQVLGQLQAELFELRKAVDDLRRVVTKEEAL